jgi:hypothetical protein
MTTKEIIIQWLKENHYDGLRGYDCGCELNDLMPCGEWCPEDCEAGYKHEIKDGYCLDCEKKCKYGSEYDFCICSKKTESETKE